MSRRGETRLICYLLLLAGLALACIPIVMPVRYELPDIIGGSGLAAIALFGLYRMRRRRRSDM